MSLARAALADPAVLVLDEATSSLDPGTEALVEAAVDRLLEGRTVVVIAHRLSTSERADMVGVVDGGELVELGHPRRPGRPRRRLLAALRHLGRRHGVDTVAGLTSPPPPPGLARRFRGYRWGGRR